MHEVRTASRPALADISGGGFFIRRVESPGAVLVKGAVKPRARQALSPSSNKENVPPVGAVWVAPKRRSPLPDWYPRTPLRDIKSIVKAIERRNRLQNAAAQQQILWTEDSSQSVDPITPAQVPTTEGGQAVASPATSLDDPALADLMEKKLSSSLQATPSDCSLQATPSKPNDPALADLMEKKLSSSIEQIEKMVRRNLKKTPKAAQPSKRIIQRHTLMSMR
ncbi:protein POLYCHOME-like [Miscanthus floridulus]|uniref:protein POLYCHOME-like n=1 Tax=Miscanthus floridulus TaxID=154761 RepID=UPI003457B9CA